MSQEPKYDNWQQIVDLLAQSVGTEQHAMLLGTLMTEDERESLVARVNILCELLNGDMSQRQISQMLGVGIATITRGSNALKTISDEDKQQLVEMLNRE